MLKFVVESSSVRDEYLVFIEIGDSRALFLAFDNEKAAANAAMFFNQLAQMQSVLTYPGKKRL